MSRGQGQVIKTGKRNLNALVAQETLESVGRLKEDDVEPTFNAILDHLRARGSLSNHRSLRRYLDYLTHAGALRMREVPARVANVRPKQVYSLTQDGPFVEAGERALALHGLSWTLPFKSSLRAATDTEGVVRGRIEGGVLYASLEDSIVENLARNKGGASSRQAITFSAALLTSTKLDRSYLMRRAKEEGVAGLVQELLDEIEYLVVSPKPEVDDLKSLYEIRRRLSPSRSSMRRTTLPRPAWSALSKDELVDLLAKQLGLK
jgi:hypothetical protein